MQIQTRNYKIQILNQTQNSNVLKFKIKNWNFMRDLSKAYNPKEVEGRIYKFWEDSGYFNPDKQPNIKKGKKPFAMVIPPPNITGSLHMGHALNNTIQDILIRRARMKGCPTLWVPGTDHAGIATQNVVEKKLRKDGKTRHDLGREKFLEEIWKWKDQYGHTIIDQLKKMGCSCDWSRQRFTMDANYAKAVEAAFNHYYNMSYIYKGVRVINWCVRCQTSLSDLEVEHKEQNADLYYFRYDKKFPITIATTRPETKLGDTAVAVNPNDNRYKKFIGKIYSVNFAGSERKIKIISDKSIDMKFGTGALGVTPAHSLIDAEMAEMNNLPQIKIINEFGKMTAESGEKFKDLKVEEAREKIIEFLKDNNLLEKTEPITNNLSVCYRCGRSIEPLPSEQWFLKMKDLIKPAIDAAQKNKIKYCPNNWKKVSLDWMKNIKDWCISRQLWWGHKIPIKGETDVLDTWFSSALWPFAVLGWPENKAKDKRQKAKASDLDKYYPTTILSTDRGIINLWVARMIFSGLEFMGKIPFSEVYIHPTVFNKEGKRMSKSLGTGIDPLELIEKYGTDAMRFGLMYQNTGVQDMKFSEDAILTGKKFANKIWNASRFVMMSLTDTRIHANKNTNEHELSVEQFINLAITESDRKIIRKLSELVKKTDKYLDKFQFGQAAHELYEFFWHDFCDKYLEEAKIQLKTEDLKLKTNTQNILSYVLISILKLLHPFMPFITEEIYDNLRSFCKDKKLANSIMVSDWPGRK